MRSLKVLFSIAPEMVCCEESLKSLKVFLKLREVLKI